MRRIDMAGIKLRAPLSKLIRALLFALFWPVWVLPLLLEAVLRGCIDRLTNR